MMMNEPRPVLDEERLRRLVRELDAVVRRELPAWTAHNAHDLGTTLLELVGFLGDTLANYMDRIADEAYLQMSGGSRVTVCIDGSQWGKVVSLESSGRDDTVYVIDEGADGSAAIHFGDGQQGRRPRTGAHVTATYRVGTGVVGNRVVVTILWPPKAPLDLEVHASAAGISFAPPKS
jgi:hypothetical protein